MHMRSELRAVRTGAVPSVVDLTDECAEFVRSEGDGLLQVFVPHATAGVAIIETGAGSDDDLLAQLDELLPRDDRWRHRHGAAGHGRDHVLPAFVADEEDGLLHVFVPHATAGIAVLETGAGSDDDLLAALGDLLPADDRWRHQHGTPGHGRSHVMPALVAPYATVPVLGGRLALGTWQSICLVDLNVDNADREVRLSFLAG